MVTTIPGMQPGCLSGADARRLVNLQANAMAGGVGKCLRQTLPAQHAARRLVHLPAAYARAHRGHRGLLGFKHRVVGIPLSGFGFPR